MSTRSYIFVEKNCKLRGIYCHRDGYPDGVGDTLREFYNTQEAAESLIELGDISSLDADLDKTVAYHRDLGAELRIHEFDNLKTFESLIKDSWAAYYYLFFRGEWYVCSFSNIEYGPWVKVKDYLNGVFTEGIFGGEYKESK